MRNVILILLLFPILAFPSATAQSGQVPSSVKSFYNKYKRQEGVRNVKLPGWLVWIGSGIAYDMVKDEEAKMALRLAKKVKKLRFMLAEEANPIPPAEVSAFVRQMREKQSYDELIYVREEGTTVSIMVKDKKDKLKDILILVNDDSDFVFFSMKSRIKYKDLVDTINYYLARNRFWDKYQPTPPQKKKKSAGKRNKSKLPQA